MLPGVSYYLSRWYTKDELAFRIAMYIGMSKEFWDVPLKEL